MTERGPRTGSQGAPDPAEPSHSGECPAPAGRPAADLSAVRRTDAIIESLAARHAAASVARPAGGPERPRQADDLDPAVRLLRALITDVDEPGPGCDGGFGRDAGPEPPPPAPSGPGSGPRRRGPRTIVALGVAGAVLASTGVAAANGGVADRTTASPAPSTSGVVSEDADRPANADTDAGTLDRPRPPVRPAPAPEQSTSRTPSGEPRDYGPVRTRPRHLFPDRPRPRRSDAPPTTTRGGPTRGTDDPSDDDNDTRGPLDDLRQRPQKNLNLYPDRD